MNNLPLQKHLEHSHDRQVVAWAHREQVLQLCQMYLSLLQNYFPDNLHQFHSELNRHGRQQPFFFENKSEIHIKTLLSV